MHTYRGYVFSILLMIGVLCYFTIQIFEDIAFVRPTLFAATPRFYNVIYDQFQQTLKELTEKYKMEAISQRGDESLDPKDTATPQV